MRLLVVRSFLLQGLPFFLESQVSSRRHGLDDRRQLARLQAAREDSVERVIILGRDRIKLVVVAAGAGHRQPHQAPRDHVDAIVDDIVDIVEKAPAKREEPQRRQRPLVAPQRQAVGSELLQDELVVRQIIIEGADYVIAIGVSVRVPPLLREQVALGIGVTGHIEPVPAPALSVVRRGQQALDHLGKSLRGAVRLKLGYFPSAGRQTEQVECRSAN